MISSDMNERRSEMKKYVSLNKRSKKAQKEYYSKQRRTWGVLNPVTRSVPGGKAYNREKDKQERRRIGGEFSDGFDADFLCLAKRCWEDAFLILD